VIAADTSVVVAAFASWHAQHDAGTQAIAGARLPAHAASETYSVLTRLPAPHRASTDIVMAFLEAQFPDPWLTLDTAAHRQALSRLSALDVDGGATYDGLIALTVAEVGGTLVTCDLRAERTYRRCGVALSILAGG
jgi:hypothetical protein